MYNFVNIYFVKCFLFINILKYIFFIFLKLFLILEHQNNLKISKNINLKQKKINIFKKSIFETQKQTDLNLEY
jgi:hypothetical protein